MAIFKKIKVKLEKYRFDKVISNIYKTKPLIMSEDGPIFLSQLCHRDLASYLLALKSIYTYFGRGIVKIINDGSLTPNDIDILNTHIPNLEIIEINSISTSSLPSGGTWERLIKIIELTRNNYVIQLDADVLTMGPINHVVECFNENRSFILGTYSGKKVNHVSYTSELARSWISSGKTKNINVGLLAEANLDSIPNSMPSNYVHGSSGFAGFGKEQFEIESLEQLSAFMYQKVGTRWREWGSEQIASNYVLANASDTGVLPLDLYACHEPHVQPEKRSLVHFIGSHRYSDGTYRNAATDIINKMLKF